MGSRWLGRLLLLSLLSVGAAACTGSVNLDVTDAPVDKAQNIFVQFSGVTFRPTGADPLTVTFSPPKTIDLLALKDGDTSSLISGRKMRDGGYDSITLNVNAVGDGSDSYLILTGSTTKIPLVMSSANAGGLTITGGFSVKKDSTQNYVVDFDLRKSVLDGATTASYQLKPALRLVDADDSGSISGTVAGAGANGCAPAVYVYKGSGVTTGDEGSANSPYMSTLVRKDNASGNYVYKAAFLPPGDYTVATTCSADKDIATVGGDITVTDSRNVSVQSGVDTAQNF